MAWVKSEIGPSNIQKVTKTPTARKATSLTMDSAAMASIRPCWCSVVSICRVPNSTANAAIERATKSAMSPGTACTMAESTLEWDRMVRSDDDTALSCKAM